MAEHNQTPLDANPSTQTFSSTSTIDQFDYKVKDSDLALLADNHYNIAWEEHTTSIQLCMNKLNALSYNPSITQSQIDNCFAKLKKTYDLLNY